MKFFVILMSLVVSSCFSCAHFPAMQKQYDVKDSYESIARVSVTTKDDKGSIVGTAFAVDDRHLVTAGHFCVGVVEGNIKGVFDDKIDILIVYHNSLLKLKGVLEIESIDERLDICVLRGDHGLVPLKFADFSTVDIGDKAFVVGAPLSLFPIFSEGRVAIPKFEVGDGREMLFLGIHVSPGNSGSPVLDENGEIIGMIVMQIVPTIVLMADSPFALAQRGDIIKKFVQGVTQEEEK